MSSISIAHKATRLGYVFADTAGSIMLGVAPTRLPYACLAAANVALMILSCFFARHTSADELTLLTNNAKFDEFVSGLIFRTKANNKSPQV